MKLITLLSIAVCGTTFAELSDKTKEMPHGGSGTRVTKMRTVDRDGKKILDSIEFSNPDGVVTQRKHMLHVAGEWIASLDDNGADGSLNGVAVLNPTTRSMEYFYVEDGLRLAPASDEEMNDAKAVGEDFAAFITDIINGEEISVFKVTALRFKIWLRKWEASMVFVVGILAVYAFFIGRRMALRSEQGADELGRYPKKIS